MFSGTYRSARSIGATSLALLSNSFACHVVWGMRGLLWVSGRRMGG